MFKRNENQQPEIPADMEFFVIYDSKVQAYREPILAVNKFDLLRQIDTLFRNPESQKNQLVMNAEDFSVFKIGDFTKKTGVIKTQDHEHICNLHEIRSSIEAEKHKVQRDVSPKQALFPT